MRHLTLALLLTAGIPLAASAADDPRETACHAKDSTMEITDCVHKLTDQWDKRLNTAYQAAQKAAENDARKTGLLKAQRGWLAYRTANCEWYGAVDGTIRQIYFVDCMLDMTRARAMELETALKP